MNQRPKFFDGEITIQADKAADIKVLSLDQAANYLGVSLSTMHKLKDRIPKLRIGRTIKFLQTDLNAYLESKREGGSK